jgi:hypothetical protein
MNNNEFFIFLKEIIFRQQAELERLNIARDNERKKLTDEIEKLKELKK